MPRPAYAGAPRWRIGRVGLPEAVEPLVKALGDDEPEVRQVAAFALGLIGSPSAPAAAGAGADRQRRRASGPCRRGARPDRRQDRRRRPSARWFAAMSRPGRSSGVQPDDLTSPLAPPVEAVRLGLFALARLAVYEPIAAAVLGADGQPVSRWWPIAYALQRVGDARAAPALLSLRLDPGALHGVVRRARPGCCQGHAVGRPALRELVEQPRDAALMIQAIRALAALGDRPSLPLVTRIVSDSKADPAIRLEAMTALAALADARTADILVELVADAAPAVRALAMRALARVDAETFTATLSGLDADPDWTVRVAQAARSGHTAREPGIRAPLGDGRRQRRARRARRARGARGIESAWRGRPDSRAAHAPRLRGPFGRGAGARAAQGRQRRARFARGLHRRRRGHDLRGARGRPHRTGSARSAPAPGRCSTTRSRTRTGRCACAPRIC